MNARMEAQADGLEMSLRAVSMPPGCPSKSSLPHPTPALVPAPGEPYLKEVIPLAGQNLALPPTLEEPPELHEEQQEVVLELLGLLHQHVLLLAPEFLLQPPLEAQALQLKLAPQERPLLILLQLEEDESVSTPSGPPSPTPSHSRPRIKTERKVWEVPVGAPCQGLYQYQLNLLR